VKRDLFVVGDPGGIPDGQGPWRVTACASPAEALAILEGGAPCDVVVCSGLGAADALQFLARLRDGYPAAVRLLLAGPNGMGTALRTADLAHQVLPARSDPAVLTEALERTLAVRDLLANDSILRLAGAADGLPSLPGAFAELTRVLESPLCGAPEIADVVRRDPALAAKMLQLVNSSFFGLGRRLTEVGEAVAYLGTAMVRSLVLSTEAMSLFRAPAAAAGIDVEELQHRAVESAALAAKLAPPGTASDAFAAALLQDIGVLLLAAKAPEELARPEAERGFTHAEVGAYLLGVWGLPTTVVEAVAHHHDAPGVRHRAFEVMDAVYVAVRLTTGTDAGDGDYLSGLEGVTDACREMCAA